ncbi:MAG TPA: dTDP-4-dehydrorhamnose reductase [Kofleriaceae bacterium]|nr:dTDP-4-dehydrorhamnose reductase [Kofleriaceae bacterium]
MKVLVTGGRGQLGRSLVRAAAARGDVAVALGADALDVTAPAQIDAALRAHAPAVVINAAAFTAVDRAEAERARAFAINADGAGHVARACAAAGVLCLHVSTDYVFDGAARRPYREDDPVSPQNVYGASKAAGERQVLDAGGAVVRTSWLFGEGGPSFVHSMLRLARELPALRVVADQRGCPTCADDLAAALLELATRAPSGIYHARSSGPTTWHGLAIAIVAEAHRHTQLACERVEPITTADYPTPARRPAYSVLDTGRLRALGIALPSWRVGLGRMIAAALGGL